MIRATTFAGASVAVFGLGATGIATGRALAAGGADVAAWDDNEAARTAAAAAGLPVVDLGAADWSRFKALALAPGVPLTHPAPHWTVTRARAARVPVIGDIEIFCRERVAHCADAPFVAITGTNGKSTTTALIAHLLKSAGRDAQLGGNIGTPILDLDPPAPDRIHVIEMSSFQIDLTPSLAPSIGVLLNLSPDHLDRHGSMEHYAAVKARLVMAARHAVIGIADDWCRAVRAEVRKAGRPFEEVAVDAPVARGVEAEGSRIVAVVPQIHPLAMLRRPLADLAGIGSLRGRHNAQNAATAAAVVTHFGLTPKEIAEGLRTFPGLPHRMEEVGRRERVLFINDSKATNADSTEKALAAFPCDIHWILGGKPKEGGISTLSAYFPRIARAYLIGEASDAFAAALAGKVATERCGTLERALEAAARDAAASSALEPVVLLSPACASYDQFRNFEQRGDLFRRLVREMPGVLPPGGAAV